jgi:hypothetical protein
VACGINRIANWEVTEHRAADLAEAVVGAAFLQFGWEAARSAAELLHPGICADGAEVNIHRQRSRVICEVGAQVFDTGVSIDLFDLSGDVDEAELSRRRARAIRNAVRAEIATAANLRRARSDLYADVADDLDFFLGQRCISDGVELAVFIARSLAGVEEP